MVDNSEFSDMSPAEVPEPPRLVGAIPYLRELWFNPVFQRYYERSRLRLYIAPLPAFFIALSYSIAANGLFIFMTSDDADLEFNATLLLGAITTPISFVVGITSLVMFYFCLVMTPIDLRRDAVTGEEDPVMTTPLNDWQVYLGSCLPNFVKGLLVGESVLAMLLGILIPCIPSLFVLVRGFELEPSLVIFGGIGVAGAFLIAVVSYILMTLLLVLAAGMYSSFLQVFGTIIATLLHYLFLTRVAGIVNVLGIFMPVTWEILTPYDFMGPTLLWFLLLEIAKKILIAFGCFVTAMIGVSIFASVRRPGTYYGTVTPRYRPGQQP